ncbi:hypothetical protein MC885_002270 [Smutsia gigantea]|nr:hypothetical protein MC885_002270 [Smutsia gigantea]
MGLSVPSCPPRKGDQQGHLSRLQKVQWGLRPDKPQQELTHSRSRAVGQDSRVDLVGRTQQPAKEEHWEWGMAGCGAGVCLEPGTETQARDLLLPCSQL